MALSKDTLQNSIYAGLKKIYTDQSNQADNDEYEKDPLKVVDQMSKDIAKCIADAVDTYVKSGDIIIGPDNILVTSTAPGSPATVAPANPAKLT